jgi:hypothetical protein
MRIGPLEGLWARWSEAIDQRWGWSKLPPFFGAMTLMGLRTNLRRDNLADTEGLPAREPLAVAPENPRWRTARSSDGSYNDVRFPTMGLAGARFGRNVPVERTAVDRENLLRPSPRRVSLELMTRDRLIPASTLNLLAAAWLQFMVHDWLQHGKNQSSHPFEIQLASDDPWPDHPMRIYRTRHDPRRPEGVEAPPSFANTVTPWWDGSQIYGSDEKTQKRVRSREGGKLKIGDDGLLPLDEGNHQDVTGVTANYWLGLGLFHTLFTLEHNAICDALAAAHPGWGDDELFDRARLVNSALLAKIHTVEWTPGILGNPTLHIAMTANWWGLLGRRVKEQWGRLSKSEALSGIPGSPTDQFGVPYSITEEFVAVYRMHPLIPDDYDLRSHRDDTSLRQCTFPELAFHHTREVMEEVPMADLLYSFGTMHPGAITLHNFPRFLQRLARPEGRLVDLAATDILRSRERGVPRYNEFRRLLHKKPVESFAELTTNANDARLLEEIYDGDLESVDVTVGLFAEPLPRGFGFSDTAFRIFILMASRRLNSDRFFTADFRPEIYTETGMRWINENGFADVLRRHFPELGEALAGVPNPFAPWHLAGTTRGAAGGFSTRISDL